MGRQGRRRFEAPGLRGAGGQSKTVRKGASGMKPALFFFDETIRWITRAQGLASPKIPLLADKIFRATGAVVDIPVELFQKSSPDTLSQSENVRVWLNAETSEIQRAHRGGCGRIVIEFDPLRENKARFERALETAHRYGMGISWGCMDGNHCTPERVGVFQDLIEQGGIQRLIVADREGRMEPFATERLLTDLRKKIGCPLEYHANNSMGMATANVLSALRSGIRHVAVSVGGVGQCPAYEEVAMSAKYLLQIPLTVSPQLAPFCHEVLAQLGQRIVENKAIIGSGIFSHESGIHVDGVMKKSELYEPFSPETVGLIRRIVIGKHSGRAALSEKLRQLGMNIHPAALPGALEKVREVSIRQKGPLSDEQLAQVIREVEF